MTGEERASWWVMCTLLAVMLAAVLFCAWVLAAPAAGSGVAP